MDVHTLFCYLENIWVECYLMGQKVQGLGGMDFCGSSFFMKRTLNSFNLFLFLFLFQRIDGFVVCYIHR